MIWYRPQNSPWDSCLDLDQFIGEIQADFPSVSFVGGYEPYDGYYFLRATFCENHECTIESLVDRLGMPAPLHWMDA